MKKAIMVWEDVCICMHNDILGNMPIEHAQACACGSFGRWFYAGGIGGTCPRNKSTEQSAILPTRGICRNPREPVEFNLQNADWQNFYSVGALLQKEFGLCL